MHALSHIFTNNNKDHTMRILERLGMKDCFDGIICFETQNKSCKSRPWDKVATPQIFDITRHLARSGGKVDMLPKTPVQCKPNFQAMKTALDMFSVDPSKAVYISMAVFTALKFGLQWTGVLGSLSSLPSERVNCPAISKIPRMAALSHGCGMRCLFTCAG